MAFPSNPIYKLVNSPDIVDDGKTIAGTLVNIRTATDDFIPIAEDNTMYQEYLSWVAEGNTAEAAD
tara:strand:- start:5 stop:202 length:198 start_codon:yes stop_codon:yes gene_type:complete